VARLRQQGEAEAPGRDRRAFPVLAQGGGAGRLRLPDAIEIPQDDGPVAQVQGRYGLIGQPEGVGSMGGQAVIAGLGGFRLRPGPRSGAPWAPCLGGERAGRSAVEGDAAAEEGIGLGLVANHDGGEIESPARMTS
jgi:hypothetical protein